LIELEKTTYDGEMKIRIGFWRKVMRNNILMLLGYPTMFIELLAVPVIMKMIYETYPDR
jgi:hypothetical protein